VLSQLKADTEAFVRRAQKKLTDKDIRQFKADRLSQLWHPNQQDEENQEDIQSANIQLLQSMKWDGLPGGAPGRHHHHSRKKKHHRDSETSSSSQSSSQSASTERDPSDAESNTEDPNITAEQTKQIVTTLCAEYKSPLERPELENQTISDAIPSSLFIGQIVENEAHSSHRSNSSSSALAVGGRALASESFGPEHTFTLSPHPRKPHPSIIPPGLSMRTFFNLQVVHPKKRFPLFNFVPFEQTKSAINTRLGQVHSTVPIFTSTKPNPQPIDDKKTPPVPASEVEKMLADFDATLRSIFNQAVGAGDLFLADDPINGTKYNLDIVWSVLNKINATRVKRIALVTGNAPVESIREMDDEFIPRSMLGMLNAALKVRTNYGLFQKEGAGANLAGSSSSILANQTHSESSSSASTAPPEPNLSNDDMLREIHQTIKDRQQNYNRNRGGYGNTRGRGGGGGRGLFRGRNRKGRGQYNANKNFNTDSAPFSPQPDPKNPPLLPFPFGGGGGKK
jgi:hypothetical protein